MSQPGDRTYLALDVGERRIGLAIANSVARLPLPLMTLLADETFWQKLSSIIEHEQVNELIVGLPRGLDGQETSQTAHSRKFARELAEHTSLPVHLQDEAGTSLLAHEKLAHEKKDYSKGDVDMYAAAFILDDFLNLQLQGAVK